MLTVTSTLSCQTLSSAKMHSDSRSRQRDSLILRSKICCSSSTRSFPLPGSKCGAAMGDKWTEIEILPSLGLDGLGSTTSHVT